MIPWRDCCTPPSAFYRCFKRDVEWMSAKRQNSRQGLQERRTEIMRSARSTVISSGLSHRMLVQLSAQASAGSRCAPAPPPPDTVTAEAAAGRALSSCCDCRISAGRIATRKGGWAGVGG